MKSKRKKIGNIVIIIGIALLLCAGGLFMYNAVESSNYSVTSNALVTRIKEEVKTASSTAETNEYEEPKTTVTEAAELSAGKGFEPVEIDGIFYDGYLTIPSIELEMAVYDTWNEDLLHKSLCRYYGAPETNDYIIAGHNYKSSFGKLKDLNTGDEVYFTDMNGTVTLYTVEQIEVIGGTDISRMLEGEWDMSLYTCTYGGRDRLTIRCKKISD